MLVERFNVVRYLLVLSTMTLVPRRVFQQDAMQLLDVIFGKRDVGPALEDQFHAHGVARDLLLVA